MEKKMNTKETLRILPIRQTVLFPHNIYPVTAGKEMSAEAIDYAIRSGATLGIVAQKSEDKDSENNGLYFYGTEAKVLKIIRFPDSSSGAVFQGIRRFRIEKFISGDDETLTAEVEFLPNTPEESMDEENLALGKSLKQLVQKAVSLSPNIPNEANLFIESLQEPGYLADLVIPYLSIDVPTKQSLLEIVDHAQRLKKVHFYLTREIEILELSQKIQNDVKSEISKQQKKFFLKEQLRFIQKELGEVDNKPSSPTGGSSSSRNSGDLTETLEKSAMPQEAKEIALKEVERMNMMQPGSPEYMVSHSYVNWLLDIPWGELSQGKVTLDHARKVLDEDHFGLEKLKKRILEFIAIYSLKQQSKGPILLLVGPPGVGKTSLGKSIARALNRKFVRIALGGIRDEAEIRGHRRTYIGSLPGKFAEALKKAGTMNPVILLDEIDKVSSDFRGDPSSALLEVLDPEQNHTFTDHYLNVPLDLSQVIFIATANTLQTIPAPLLDRLEKIELSGYTLQEKQNIAQKYLIPQVIEEQGLKGILDLRFLKAPLQHLIQEFTAEAGVRELKRKISALSRSLILETLEAKGNFKKKVIINATKDSIAKHLGRPIYLPTRKAKTLPCGVSTGLAYTSVGGDVLYIETVLTPKGNGSLSITGQLGDVMKESALTALAYLKSQSEKLHLNQTLLNKSNIHLHCPAGAIKKDGPSAGLAILSALTSQYLQIPIPSKIAMTGEISLRGDVLPVGGIKEKLIAAHRHGIQKVFLPMENEKDLDDLPKEVLSQLEIIFVQRSQDLLNQVFNLNY
jgi:ATP-dependent Lon protease